MTDSTFYDWYCDTSILAYGEIEDREILEDLMTIMKWKNALIFVSTDIPDNRFTVKEYWLLLGMLEHDNLIEYGTSPRGAWLTEKGKELLEYLDNTDMDHIIYFIEHGIPIEIYNEGK